MVAGVSGRTWSISRNGARRIARVDCTVLPRGGDRRLDRDGPRTRTRIDLDVERISQLRLESRGHTPKFVYRLAHLARRLRQFCGAQDDECDQQDDQQLGCPKVQHPESLPERHLAGRCGDSGCPVQRAAGQRDAFNPRR